MEKILTKTANVSKGKEGKYGVIKIENKKLAPYFGKELNVTIRKVKK